MTTNLSRLWRTLAVALVVAVSAYLFQPHARIQAQTSITSTTLASAVTNNLVTQVSLTSGTGVSSGVRLYIDRELFRVQGAVGGSTTLWNVVRGERGVVSAHNSGAQVYLGPALAFPNSDIASGTSCASTDALYFPRINPTSGQMAECEAGTWMAWSTDKIRVRDFTVRDSFWGGHQILQDDGTVKSLTDNEANIVYDSPLGSISFREEQNKTASSWIEINGYLDISGDGTNNEGVEILFGDGTDPTTNQWLEIGTQGGCIAAAIQVADISGTDELAVGFRQNEAWSDPTLHSAYTRWNSAGLSASAGAIVSEQEISSATQSDTSGYTWADAETRAIKVCYSKAGVPTAFVSDAFTPSITLTDRPTYHAVTMTNSGATMTAGTGMFPFISFVHDVDVAENTRIRWVELTRLP